MTSQQAICICLAGLAAGATAQTQEHYIRVGDAQVTGMGSFRTEKTAAGGVHFVVAHGSSGMLTLQSAKDRLTATCAKAEGDIDSKNTLQKVTMTGGVRARVTRPSSEPSSNMTQTATASGIEATYSGATDLLHLTGGVDVTDDDPAAKRMFHATGETATLTLSPQQSKEQAFRAATLSGGVQMQMTGMRNDNGARIPFTVNATCNAATFDSQSHTVSLQGHVRVTGDDPSTTGGSYVEKEVIHLNPDGSVESVEGFGDPGTDSIDVSKIKG